MLLVRNKTSLSLKISDKIYAHAVRNISPCGSLWYSWLQRAESCAAERWWQLFWVLLQTDTAQLRDSSEHRRGAPYKVSC